MRAGQVAAAAGVNRQTLRYYERRGLIAEPDRTLGGHRQYPPETVRLLRARLRDVWPNVRVRGHAAAVLQRLRDRR